MALYLGAEVLPAQLLPKARKESAKVESLRTYDLLHKVGQTEGT